MLSAAYRLAVSAFALFASVLLQAGEGQPMGSASGASARSRTDQGARAAADSAFALIDRDVRRSYAYAMVAVEKARRASDLPTLHDALNAKRQAHYLRGETEQLMQTSLEALSVAEDLGDERAMGEDNGWMSVAMMELRQPEKAYQYAQRALAHMRSTKDSAAVAQGLCDLSNACRALDKSAEALMRISEAIRISEALHDADRTAYAQTLLGSVLMDGQRWSDALPTLLQAYRHVSVNGTEGDRCSLERDIAATYAGMGRWDDAEGFLEKAEGRAGRMNAVRELPHLLEVRVALLEARGDESGALASAKRLMVLKDSLLEADVAGRIASLNAMHDLVSKEDEMARLGTENAAFKVTLAQADRRWKWSLAGIVLLVAAFLVSLGRVRALRKAKQLLGRRNERIHELLDQLRRREMEQEQQRLRLAEAILNEESKDLLLKEIHHRVKNNLQVVNTLLKMQALYLNEPRLDEAFSEAQGRVRSMALVHEHIYKVGDLNRVNVKAHVLALAEGILAYHGLKDKVQLDLHVTYDKASVETLMPLSLLLNELITNAAKHAFAGQDRGMIRIGLRRMPDGRCELSFSDDGSGMRQEQVYEGHSFGMELIRTLAEQLEGRIRLLKGEGTTFELQFDAEPRQFRIAS